MEATTLTSLLAAASLTHLRRTLEDEELTDLKTLKWMITDEASDFSETMQEIGVSAQDAVALKLALLRGDGPEPAASVPPACTAPAAVIAPPVVVAPKLPAKLEPPAKKVKAEVSLAAFLEGVKLPQLVEKLQSAGLTHAELQAMAKNSSIGVKLGKLGVGLRDAMTLKLALLRGADDEDYYDDEPAAPPTFAPEPPVSFAPEPPVSFAPEPPVAPGPQSPAAASVDVSDEGAIRSFTSMPPLLGQRVLISGLVKRADLNGKYGFARKYSTDTDQSSGGYSATDGRYTVEVEGDDAHTYNLKPSNLTYAAPPPQASRPPPRAASEEGAPAAKPKAKAETMAQTMAEAAKAPAMVTKWTPDGPKLVPATHAARSNPKVMEALQAMGQAKASAGLETARQMLETARLAEGGSPSGGGSSGAAGAADAGAGDGEGEGAEAEEPAASAEVDDDASDAAPGRGAARAPQQVPSVFAPSTFSTTGSVLPSAPSDVLAAALAAVTALDTSGGGGGGVLSASVHDPTKPVVKSFTQINHVEPEGGGKPAGASQFSVGRGSKNKALAAYQRRDVNDPSKGIEDYELDTGTVSLSGGHDEATARLKRDEAKLKSGEASYLGASFNAI